MWLVHQVCPPVFQFTTNMTWRRRFVPADTYVPWHGGAPFSYA